MNSDCFDHNIQSLRILILLEDTYKEHKGLNLSINCLDGLLKHNGPIFDKKKIDKLIGIRNLKNKINFNIYPSLEAQIAAISDDIAYNNHDIQDGLKAKLFNLNDLLSLNFFKEIYKPYKNIRNISKEEIPFLKRNSKRIKIFWAKDKSKWDLNKFKRLIKNKNVYITFDVDGLDSGIMPATGTPEPGGLFWDETLNILKIAAKNSNIVGADLNELSPIKGFNSYNFLAAKLVYKILSYKFLY